VAQQKAFDGVVSDDLAKLNDALKKKNEKPVTVEPPKPTE
jgi:hypothetical protein